MIQIKSKAPRKGNKNKNTSKSSNGTTVVVQQQRPPKSSRRPNSRSINPFRHYWLASLINPFTNGGARIPDNLVSPTATATLRQRFTVNPVLDSVLAGTYNAGIQFIPTIATSYGVATASANNVLTFPNFSSFTTFSQSSVVSPLMTDYRITSAGLAIYSTTAFAVNQGHNICGYVPGNDRIGTAGSIWGGNQNINTALAYANISDVPVNTQKVCSISWVPSDETNYAFHSSNSSYGGATMNTTYYPGGMFWYGTGLSQTASYQAEVVLNIEYHPTNSTVSLVNTSPSYADQIAMQTALNHPIVSNMFHHIPPEAVYETISGSTVKAPGSYLQSVLADFGNKIYPAIQDATRRTIATFNTPSFASSVSNGRYADGIGALFGVPVSALEYYH